MKILHVIDSAGLYGAETMLLNLVQEQMHLGLFPVICSIGERACGEKALETEAIRKGFHVEKFRVRAGPNLLGAWKILDYAQAHRFDVIHSHGYKSDILFGFMPRPIRRIPLVATLHGWTNTGQLTRMKIYEWLDAKSLRHMDAVVAVGTGMLSDPRIKRNAMSNLVVINNGLPPVTGGTDIAPAPGNFDSKLVDFCKAGFTVGSIGRLSEEKGHVYLVEAVSFLRDMYGNIRLVIIGEGPRKKSLEGRIAALGLQQRVLLPGYRANARQYLEHFGLFVLPSLTEGLPITLLEAMQSRVPIIATRVGGMPEALQHGRAGLLVEPASAESLAKAVYTLQEQPGLARELASTAYKRVTTDYSSRLMALKYCELYKSVIDRQPTGVAQST